MCDEDIHQGLTYEAPLSRRAFGLSAAAVATMTAAAAHAQDKVVEKDVDVKTPDGVADSALFYPARAGTFPAAIIWTDILGLRPVFRDMGRRLAAQGYVVLVPNPFYRLGRAPSFGPDFDFNKPSDRDKAMGMMASLTQDTTMKDGPAMTAFLDAQPQTSKKIRMGVQGYCMGGPLAFRTAAASPARYGALVTCHGAALVTGMPDSPHLLIPKMKVKAYCAVASNDDMREPKSKDVLRASFAAAHETAGVEVYPGALHGWCVKGGAVYNAAAAEKAWAEMLATYKSALV